MRITTGKNTIDYGVTQNGQMYEAHTVGSTKIVRATPDPERFLRWMIQSEIDEDLKHTLRIKSLLYYKIWWELPDDVCKAGRFNKELYLKIIQAKKDNGTL
jgi:hypothetical protein